MLDNYSHTMTAKRTGTKCAECSEFLFCLIDLFLFMFFFPLLLSMLLKLTSCATTQNNSKHATISLNNRRFDEKCMTKKFQKYPVLTTGKRSHQTLPETSKCSIKLTNVKNLFVNFI